MKFKTHSIQVEIESKIEKDISAEIIMALPAPLHIGCKVHSYTELP